MELWYWLSKAMGFPGLERLLAKNQEIWETEYNEFINELSTFVNKKFNQFQRSIIPMGESISEFYIYSTHVRKSTQATSQRIDRVQ